MPRVKLFDIVFDLTALNRLMEHVERGGRISESNPLGRGLRRASEIYRDYLKQRYIRLANTGDATWPDIEESTEKRKARRTPGTEKLRLRETDTILDHIIVKKVRREFAVGVFEGSKHPYSDKTVVRLTQMHEEGESTPKKKKWYIIVHPDEATRKRMVVQIGKGLRELTAIVNRERAGAR